MKKLLMLATILVAGIAANAASFKWSGANIYGPDGTTKFTGTAYLYCDALSVDALSSAAVTSGAITATTFDNASAVGDTSYDFYFKITTTYDNKEVTYTSAVKPVTALETGTATIGFGNQATATQAAGAWAAVPEPTSGLLMLLGMAGLALRRRRA